MKTYTQEITVDENNTAISLKSGSLPVFATPALVAFMENTATKTIDNLSPEETSVGICINVQHTKASGIGETLSCTANITQVDGRKISFEITAKNAKNEIIGTATHDRFVVNVEKFMRKISN